MAAFATPRLLYDMEYVKGGCVGDPPPGTTTDDIFGTYASDYLIGVVCLAAAAALLLSPKPAPFYKILGANFFYWTALGYGLAGFLHQVIHEDEEHMGHTLLWKISYGLALVGIAFLGLLANRLLVAKYSEINNCEVCLNVTVLAIVGAVTLMTFREPNLIVTGVTLLLVSVYALIAWALYGSCGKVFGLALTIAGFVVQVVLDPVCGDAAYSECWKECPLPAPYFNHNALFHTMYAVALGILAFFMATDPEVTDDSKFALLGMPA